MGVSLKLNLKKCKYCKTSVNYMRHILSLEGLFPEPEKVDSFLNFIPPSNKSEVRSVCVLLLTAVNVFQISQLLLNHWGD